MCVLITIDEGVVCTRVGLGFWNVTVGGHDG